ncbi:MAG: hypothetical protein J6T72_01760 [Alphaproteobacteria bacterium]|nr:hypothetical protein [Alphaproteobacteria bacterium]
MRNSRRIDKSAVITAFFCAIAAFICGFVFCMALLSSNESCYFLVQNFWQSTRAYKIFTYLSNLYDGYFLKMSALFFCLLLCLCILWSLVDRLFFKKKEAFSDDDSEQLDSFIDDNSNLDMQNSLNWDDLNSVKPDVLASYLQNEYPQIAAIALSQLNAEQGAAVLSHMSSNFAAVTITQLISSRPLSPQSISKLGNAVAKDILNAPHESGLSIVSTIWSHLDDSAAERIMSFLIGYAPEVAEKITKKPIAFEDLSRLPYSQIQKLVAQTDEAQLVIALLGASDDVRNRFYQVMPEQQRQIITQALQRLGGINLAEIKKAQKNIVSVGKQIFSTSPEN